jgi:hypothetical protein
VAVSATVAPHFEQNIAGLSEMDWKNLPPKVADVV